MLPELLAATGAASHDAHGPGGISMFELSAILLTLTGLFGYVNHRFVKLPGTIGLMVVSLLFSLGLVAVGFQAPSVTEAVRGLVSEIDFNATLMNFMLGYLLFAGALHVNLNDLAKEKRLIGMLATLGVVASTFIIGTIFFYLLPLFGFEVPYLYCLLFGSLISPTDPVAVLGILKRAGAPKTLETKITGESLFNDGVGVVVFVILYTMLTSDAEMGAGEVAKLFAIEAVGGVILGLVLGFIGYWLLKQIDEYQTEILISLALVTGGYALAQYLHTSGPLAMVVTGLMIGNQGRSLAMEEKTREHLDTFWELIDEILNALLFVLIGLELLVLAEHLEWSYVVVGLLAIPLVLASRFVAVSFPVWLLKPFREFTKGAIPIITWGGLRGGISVALALAMPEGEERNLFLVVTYVIVIFSICVQGLSLRRLIAHYVKPGDRGSESITH